MRSRRWIPRPSALSATAATQRPSGEMAADEDAAPRVAEDVLEGQRDGPATRFPRVGGAAAAGEGEREGEPTEHGPQSESRRNDQASGLL